MVPGKRLVEGKISPCMYNMHSGVRDIKTGYIQCASAVCDNTELQQGRR